MLENTKQKRNSEKQNIFAHTELWRLLIAAKNNLQFVGILLPFYDERIMNIFDTKKGVEIQGRKQKNKENVKIDENL